MKKPVKVRAICFSEESRQIEIAIDDEKMFDYLNRQLELGNRIVVAVEKGHWSNNIYSFAPQHVILYMSNKVKE